MAARPLEPPPPELFNTRLPKQYLPPKRLVRISGYRTGEPHFGTSGANRFDAPGCALAAVAPVTSAPGFARAQKKLGITFV